MKIGIARFPGTNCDADVWMMTEAKKHTPQWLWHQDRFDKKQCDLIVIPGGFSYGDYLRCGALAARSPAMQSVREAAQYGTPVLGICNGFQILCESELLPGILLKNKQQKFIDHWVELQVINENKHFGSSFKKEQTLRLPIAHGEGNYFVDHSTLKKMEDQEQIWLRYKQNPNGSLQDIAGISNDKKNVFALMPHPERALFDWMGGHDGWSFL